MRVFIEHEPRLIKKLAKPYHKLLEETKAKSVEIELIWEAVDCFEDAEYSDFYQAAVWKIDQYVESNDSNLIYLGLSVLKQVISKNNDFVLKYKELVLKICFSSKDLTLWK